MLQTGCKYSLILSIWSKLTLTSKRSPINDEAPHFFQTLSLPRETLTVDLSCGSGLWLLAPLLKSLWPDIGRLCTIYELSFICLLWLSLQFFLCVTHCIIYYLHPPLHKWITELSVLFWGSGLQLFAHFASSWRLFWPSCVKSVFGKCSSCLRYIVFISLSVMLSAPNGTIKSLIEFVWKIFHDSDSIIPGG